MWQGCHGYQNNTRVDFCFVILLCEGSSGAVSYRSGRTLQPAGWLKEDHHLITTTKYNYCPPSYNWFQLHWHQFEGPVDLRRWSIENCGKGGKKKRYLGAEEQLADIRKDCNHWGSAALRPRVNAAPAGSRPQPEAKTDECWTWANRSQSWSPDGGLLYLLLVYFCK